MWIVILLLATYGGEFFICFFFIKKYNKEIDQIFYLFP